LTQNIADRLTSTVYRHIDEGYLDSARTDEVEVNAVLAATTTPVCH
jgi:hypothetical protein